MGDENEAFGKEKKEFQFSIWDFIETDKINDLLDGVLEKDGKPFGIAVDIDYICKAIDAKGNLTIEARYLEDAGVSWDDDKDVEEEGAFKAK